MDAARKFVDKGQIDKAVKEYLRIVSEDPKDVRVWLKIGDLYAKKGAKQEATDTYLKVARFYDEQGFFLKAVAVYKQILKLDPRLVDVILKLAELYRRLGLMSDAMQHYESVAAHFHREGNTKDALDTVKKLVDLDPENIATRIKLAELYSKENLLDEAATQFTHACEQLRRQGRQDDFVKVAERLLWHKPDNHALNRELAGLYLRRNDPRRALQKLQACFKADPRDVETLGLLAIAFSALEQKSKTVSVLKELARIHLENKSRDKAGEVYRKILEIVPTDQDALTFVGANPAPAPVRAAVPPPPQPRANTPLPAAVRAATSDAKFAAEGAKFSLTSDMPAIPPSARMTGSMPLVDEQSLSGVDFALPEYDDADFSADMEPPPDPRTRSAAGERHAEEISKILAETDVYVKYGLHQKAVDHLRRVFTLDAENVEAHERLKDILISQGREHEAEVELLKLAELIAPSDPDRAEMYLQELLAMNGTHTGAFELARRFRLRVARLSSASAEVEYSGGGVAEVDGDLDDLELSTPPPRAIGRSRGVSPRDSVDDFDPDELIGGKDIANGSPAPGRPPRAPVQEYDASFDSHGQSTRQVPSEQIEALAQMDGAYDDDDSAILHSRAPNPSAWSGSDEDALEAQLDDAALGEDIDLGVAAELGQSDEDLPFDPDAARAFDAHMHKGETAAAYTVSGFEETSLPNLRDPQVYADLEGNEGNDGLAVAGSYDPYGAGAHDDATAISVDVIEPAHAESFVEDDLDEADFYAQQGMFPEAMDALYALLERYPDHPLVLNKMREIQALERGEQPIVHTPAAGHEVETEGVDVELDSAPIELTDGTAALDLDEIEEISDDLEEVSPDVEDVEDVEFEPAASEGAKRKPSVLLEKPVDEGDADTHYDLGLAYKEMGLFDEAAKAFDKAMRAPGREAQCRVMLGMCQREQGNPQEAIHQFKQGLHANPSDRERLSLYYEIGNTYESIGDSGEALYYFEAVTKRDPKFADAGQRAEGLRAGGGRAVQPEDDL
ncbi:MAG: tetratricopeptide repeat protein [Kofleriaceae bacterium]